MSLVPTDTTGDVVHIDQAAVLRALNLNPSDPKTQALLLVCDKYGLDPVLKHMVLIQGTPYITRDGLLANAHNSGQFDGIEVLEQGETDTHFTAKVAVYRKDMGRPIAYTGRYPKSGGNREYAPEMAVKCAEVAALRRAFNITGIATREEQWDLVDVDDIDHPPGITDDQGEQIRRLAAHLTDEQRAALTAWREGEGITNPPARWTAEEAARVIVQLEAVLDGDDDPDGGGTPAPPDGAPGPDGPGEAEAAFEPAASSTDGGAAVDPAVPSDTPHENAGGGEAPRADGEGQEPADGTPPPGAPTPAGSTDLQDVLDLVDGVTGYKQKGPRESKLLGHAADVARMHDVAIPEHLDDVAAWPADLIEDLFLLVEGVVAAISGGTAPGAGEPSGGDSPPPSGGEPASQEDTQKALVARLNKGMATASAQLRDNARHALIRHVTGGRTESSREATKDELVAAHRVLDACERGDMELHLRATGGYVVRAKGGAAA